MPFRASAPGGASAGFLDLLERQAEGACDLEDRVVAARPRPGGRKQPGS